MVTASQSSPPPVRPVGPPRVQSPGSRYAFRTTPGPWCSGAASAVCSRTSVVPATSTVTPAWWAATPRAPVEPSGPPTATGVPGTRPVTRAAAAVTRPARVVAGKVGGQDGRRYAAFLCDGRRPLAPAHVEQL